MSMEAWGEGGVRYRNYGEEEVLVQLPPPEMAGGRGGMMMVTQIVGDVQGEGGGHRVVDDGEILVLVPGCEYLIEWLADGKGGPVQQGGRKEAGGGVGRREGGEGEGWLWKDGSAGATTRAVCLGWMRDGHRGRGGVGRWPGGVIQARLVDGVDRVKGRWAAPKVEIRGHVALGGGGERYAAIFVGGTQIGVAFEDSFQTTVSLGRGVGGRRGEDKGEKGEGEEGALVVSVVVHSLDGRPTGDSLHTVLKHGERTGNAGSPWTAGCEDGGGAGREDGVAARGGRGGDVEGVVGLQVGGGAGAKGCLMGGRVRDSSRSRADAGDCERGLAGHGFVVETNSHDAGALRGTLESLLRPPGEGGTRFASCAVIDPSGEGYGLAMEFKCIHVREGGLAGLDKAVARMASGTRFLLRTDDSFVFRDTEFMDEVVGPHPQEFGCC